jgi:sulfate/thiosulfate transport system substrate-binding protein
MRRRSRGGLVRVWAGLAIAAIVALAGCGGSGAGKSGGKVTLILGGYTTPRELYGKSIIPAFQKYWKAKTGQDVDFQESYQGSGAQARAIVGGFEADIAALSLEADIDTIAKAGLITHDWRTAPHGGMFTDSIVVIAVRKGNPKGIKDWADVAQPGLNVLTPDPKTSGGAMWNINALYGAALRGYAGVPKGDPAAAAQFLKSVFANVQIMDKGARESITTFEKGVGDAAITYENEVFVGKQAGQDYDEIVPHSTILIENPVALVDANVDKHGTREVAEAFLQFLWSRDAQLECPKYGLRPVDDGVAAETASQFPKVEDLWKIDALGGWQKVMTDVYGPQGAYTKVSDELRGGR